MAEGVVQQVEDEDQEQALEEQLMRDLQNMLGDSVNDPCFQNDPEWSDQELVSIQNTPLDERMGNTAWCKCGKCIPMPTKDESCCCTEIQDIAHYFEGDVICITTVDDMLDMCMDENRLDFMIRWSGRYSRAAYRRDRNRILRKAAYRAFSTWAHGYLGLGNRIPIPSCMVNLIRKKFPDSQQRYVGFFWSNDYPAIDMAFDF
ncbi:P2X purinoceptor 7 [Xenopus laevis]|uniref:P2X purinoreceptor 7 intracellular domain-containing protein n=2 Tax=Xenopus laevis TaxID=8355 RepID=A0A974I233_XENLA|nr:P2X purinoceptor 7 [Xenopus laevis]OCT99047.1 hypothetical protein XELAEV_18004847mg [Xenopus laevis]